MRTSDLVQEAGRLVSELPRRYGLDDWTHWCTFTFTQDVATDAARSAVREMLGRCVSRVGAHVPCATVVAPQPGSRFPHAHVLLAVAAREKLPDTVVRDFWREAHRHAGSSEVEPFQPGGRAPWYLVEHGDDWEANILCPRAAACRRPGKGCRRAPGPLAI
jgi:hypothetical protein